MRRISMYSISYLSKNNFRVLEKFQFLDIQIYGFSKSLYQSCQCFMETCMGDLSKASTNKSYQERKRDSIWKNEKIYSHYSNELMIDT
jgi:hypothetical protein